MPKAQPRPKSPFTGRWRIVSLDESDVDCVKEESPAFIEFGADRMGQFLVGLTRGNLDYRLTERCGQAAEWTWDGNDEMGPAQGRGRDVIRGDELHGMIFFHGGDDSEFVARKTETSGKKAKR
jgi:hypothetical protein